MDFWGRPVAKCAEVLAQKLPSLTHYLVPRLLTHSLQRECGGRRLGHACAACGERATVVARNWPLTSAREAPKRWMGCWRGVRVWLARRRGGRTSTASSELRAGAPFTTTSSGEARIRLTSGTVETCTERHLEEGCRRWLANVAELQTGQSNCTITTIDQPKHRSHRARKRQRKRDTLCWFYERSAPVFWPTIGQNWAQSFAKGEHFSPFA